MKRPFSFIIACILFAFMLLPGSVLASAHETDIEAILSGMTLEQKVGQMMAVAFRVWKEVPTEEEATVENAERQEPEAVSITELNQQIRACLAKYQFGSVILFAENCQDAEQTLRLVQDMQSANQAGGGIPMLVSIDQEGGSGTRLGFGTSGPGNMSLAATGVPENATAMAAVYGEELRLLGIHADYAPVLDVNNNPNNPVIGVRSFSDDPETVAQYGTAFIQGLHDVGVISTLKHFPGHGNTGTDSHTGLPLIDSSYEALKAVELVPFQAAIDAGVDMVMTAHIQYPQIETETYTSKSTGEEIFLPATMSRVILTDILRGDMGFEGVIVTDALDMAAISANFTDEDMILLPINAGVDMLMLPMMYDTLSFQRMQDMTDLAVQLVRDGKISEERIDASVRRILTLKQKYSLLEQKDFTVTEEMVNAAVSGVGSEAHRNTAWEIAQKGLTLVKNENGAFPISLKPGEKTLILFADSCASRAGYGELTKQLLEEKQALPEGAQIVVTKSTRENEDICVLAALGADHVILVHRVYNAKCLDPNTDDGFSSATFDKVIDALHEKGKTAIVVSCQLPYDAARFPEADAMLLTYGSSVMRTVPPTTGAGSAYVPNLAAALCACFGQGEANGQLPVTLPTLDENYKITEQIYRERY